MEYGIAILVTMTFALSVLNDGKYNFKLSRLILIAKFVESILSWIRLFHNSNLNLKFF